MSAYPTEEELDAGRARLAAAIARRACEPMRAHPHRQRGVAAVRHEQEDAGDLADYAREPNAAEVSTGWFSRNRAWRRKNR